MSVTTGRSMRTATVVGAALAVAGWCLAGVAPASAGSIAVTASPNPAPPGAMVTLTNTGVTEAGASGGFAYLTLDYYEPNTNDCAPTASDAGRRGQGIGSAGGFATGPSFPFSHQVFFTPEGASSVYRICAYLYGMTPIEQAPETVGSTLLQVRRPAPAPAHHKKKKKHHKKKHR